MSHGESGQQPDSDSGAKRGGLLDLIELIGNKLPDPSTLFLLGLIVVMVVSWVAVKMDWHVVQKLPVQVMETVVEDGQTVERPVLDEEGNPVVEWRVVKETRTVSAMVPRLDDDGEVVLDVNGEPVLIPALDDDGQPITTTVAGGDDVVVLNVVHRVPYQVTEMVTDPETGETGEEPVLDDDGQPVVEWRLKNETRTVAAMSPLLNDQDAVVSGSGDAPQLIPTTDGVGQLVWTTVESGEDVVLRARSLLSRDGLFWILNNMVDNFMAFPPLGVVLVGMLGIGVAERTGMIGALLKAFMLVVPNTLLTPAMIFIGIMSSMAMDAGYVVLPPLAAALYKAVGRSPMAGLAAVFAGVSAGFNANLFITGLDPMLAEFATIGGQVIDPSYEMNPACNWYFMMASTVLITFVGWATTAWFVEKRLQSKSPEEGGPVPATAVDLEAQRLTPEETRGLWIGFATLVGVLGVFFAAILVPNWFLHGEGDNFDRWVEAIVPMIFLTFVAPGIAYGVALKSVRNDKDIAKLFVESMASMAPIIVLAFFAAQFIESFERSGLDRMLAMAGGQALGQADMPAGALVVVFIFVTVFFNLFIGSMSAKYAMFAPIFIPMFMMVGISPELTQAAYRIGDSVSNIITPLNAYLIIILVFMQKFVPKGGMGTLISTMLPYTIVFTIVWTIFLLIWMQLGIPLGLDGGLTYTPGG